MPISEQLEYGDVVIFSARYFVSRLTYLDIELEQFPILSFTETSNIK